MTFHKAQLNISGGVSIFMLTDVNRGKLHNRKFQLKRKKKQLKGNNKGRCQVSKAEERGNVYTDGVNHTFIKVFNILRLIMVLSS